MKTVGLVAVGLLAVTTAERQAASFGYAVAPASLHTNTTMSSILTGIHEP